MAYRDEVLADSPWLYWRFEETAGGTAEDETANNRDGTISGATLNQAGKVGQAFLFDGVDDRVSSAVNFTALTAWTAELWVNFAAEIVLDPDLTVGSTFTSFSCEVGEECGRMPERHGTDVDAAATNSNLLDNAWDEYRGLW